MPGLRLRALVLAAGLGERLRPLTDGVPKPLLPVAGLPILGYTLARLAEAGCEAAAINLHYRGEQIRQRFGEAFAGMPLAYSEEPELLGTLGALHPLRDFLAPADLVLLVNGDSLCRWPLRKLIRRHQEGRSEATLLLAERPDPESFGGGVGIGRQGEIRSFFRGDEERGEVVRRLVFAGAHALAPSLVAGVGEGRADIVRDLYIPLLERGGGIGSVATGRRWHDLGTPQRFLEGSLDWARAEWPERLWRRSWVARDAAVAPRAAVRRSAIEDGAQVGRGARVERSVLLPGARVGEEATVREVVVGFDAAVPARSWIERRVVTARRDGRPANLDDSVVGGAVYTPFPAR